MQISSTLCVNSRKQKIQNKKKIQIRLDAFAELRALNACWKKVEDLFFNGLFCVNFYSRKIARGDHIVSITSSWSTRITNFSPFYSIQFFSRTFDFHRSDARAHGQTYIHKHKIEICTGDFDWNIQVEYVIYDCPYQLNGELIWTHNCHQWQLRTIQIYIFIYICHILNK